MLRKQKGSKIAIIFNVLLSGALFILMFGATYLEGQNVYEKIMEKKSDPVSQNI